MMNTLMVEDRDGIKYPVKRGAPESGDKGIYKDPPHTHKKNKQNAGGKRTQRKTRRKTRRKRTQRKTRRKSLRKSPRKTRRRVTKRKTHRRR